VQFPSTPFLYFFIFSLQNFISIVYFIAKFFIIIS